jgi:hypothetical protein
VTSTGRAETPSCVLIASRCSSARKSRAQISTSRSFIALLSLSMRPRRNHDSEPTQSEGPPGSKEAKLDALRNAYPEELEIEGDKLRGDAHGKGASPKETEQAANKHPPPPQHG